MNATEDKRLKSRVQEITDIPTLPLIISRLIRIFQDEHASVDDLTNIIRHDQSLATRIVAVANSPFFGYQGRINSIEQAILMLGFDLVKSISLGISIFSMFPLPYGTLKRLWSHAYAVASLSSFICSCFPVAQRGVCFLAGLLHDIGRPVLMRVFREEYSEKYKRELSLLRDKELVAAEVKRFQCSHAAAGEWFLDGLTFPEEIVIPVRHHHDMTGVTRHSGITTTVYLAEGLTGVIDPAHALDGEWTAEHLKTFQEAGFREEDLKELKIYFAEQESVIRNFFDL